MTDDEYRLQRFVDAQALDYADAIAALRRRTLDPSWMAHIFPRFANCYHDQASDMFAIGSLDEARAYLAHPLLGPRMRESLAALEWLHDLDPSQLLHRGFIGAASEPERKHIAHQRLAGRLAA